MFLCLRPWRAWGIEAHVPALILERGFVHPHTGTTIIDSNVRGKKDSDRAVL